MSSDVRILLCFISNLEYELDLCSFKFDNLYFLFFGRISTAEKHRFSFGKLLYDPVELVYCFDLDFKPESVLDFTPEYRGFGIADFRLLYSKKKRKKKRSK